MGTVGDSYDNCMMEARGHHSNENSSTRRTFTTREEARQAVFEWLIWYNAERLHSSIGYMSPMEFEESWDNQEAA